MIRLVLPGLILALSLPAVGLAQDTGTTRVRPAVTEECRIENVAFARSGVALIARCGEGVRTVLATDGGNRPGGVSAFMSWAIDAQNGQTSGRDTLTINHRNPGAASQAICDELGLSGPSRRNTAPCREIVSAID